MTAGTSQVDLTRPTIIDQPLVVSFWSPTCRSIYTSQISTVHQTEGVDTGWYEDTIDVVYQWFITMVKAFGVG